MAPAGDSYLDMAERILLDVRRPMSTRQLLAEAYIRGLVPSHLHGRTQSKTLGARLSEDILHFREKSRFYRAQPGRFLLRKLLDDQSVSLEFRRPILAKRRIRELKRKDVLCLARASLQPSDVADGKRITPIKMQELLNSDSVNYAPNAANVGDNCLPVSSFVIVMRDSFALSYRVGRYRETRDAFREKRTIGFTTFVSALDNSLFDGADLGAERAGIAAMATDLDLASGDFGLTHGRSSDLLFFVPYDSGEGLSAIIAVIKFKAPEDFEPFTKRLSINDLHWVNLEYDVNNIDDFDPWSKHIICHYRSDLLGGSNGGSSDDLFDRRGELFVASDNAERFPRYAKGAAMAL